MLVTACKVEEFYIGTTWTIPLRPVGVLIVKKKTP